MTGRGNNPDLGATNQPTPMTYRLPPADSSTFTYPPEKPARRLPGPGGHTLCLRCRVGFSSYDLYLLHVETSVDHNLCLHCNYEKDFESFTTLQDHLEQDHLWCEACNFFAPSWEGLNQHLMYVHFMCVVCRQTHMSLNELTGHSNLHRPPNNECFLCDERFVLRSGLFNHLESEKCPGGALRDDLRSLSRDFLEKLPQNNEYYLPLQYDIPEDRLFTCKPCKKAYGRLSDLLQHVETRKCPEGYCKGNGTIERMVAHVQENLQNVIEARQRRGTGQTTTPNLVHPRVGQLRNEKY